MDKIIVLIIFSCDGEPTVPQVHYYHDNSTICARFCYSSGERFRSSCPVPIIIVVLPCGSSRAERLCDPSELRVRRLTAHRLGRALRSPTAGSAGSGCKPSPGFPVNGVKQRDGDASLLDFTDKTLIEPAAHTHVAIGYKCPPSN